MALETKEQINQQFKNARSILIALPERPGTDALVSALALKKYLEDQGKTVKIVSYDFRASSKLSFINDLSHVESDMGPIMQTAITIDAKKYPTDDIRYHVHNDKLQILITPKKGSLPEDAIQIENNIFIHDLIVVINTAELPSLGSLYTENKDFFFDIPVINIDHRPDNEHFGQINWVDINATSTAEMMYHYLYQDTNPTPQMATAFLAAIM